jgi:hypothetical protein
MTKKQIIWLFILAILGNAAFSTLAHVFEIKVPLWGSMTFGAVWGLYVGNLLRSIK